MGKEYKNSGLEWIGRIPKEWKACRFKNFLSLRNIASSSSIKIGLENIEGGSGRYISTDGKFDGDGIQFNTGDIVYGKLRPYLRKVWLATFEGNAVGDFFVFRNKRNSYPHYIKWLFLSDGFSEAVNSSVYGAKMPRVSSDFILSLPFFLPPLSEQQRIASYLDKKCGEIDELIALQEKMIAQLKEYKHAVITEAVTKGLDPNAKLVPSGIEWIGDVPEGWRVCRIKAIVNLQSGTNLTTMDISESGKYPVYGGNGIRGYYHEYTNEGEFVLIGRQGALCGNINYASGKFWATEHAVVCYPQREFARKWLGELLRAMNLGQYSLSAAQPGLSVERIKNLNMPLPSLPEQHSIATYLDTKCSEIDSLIALKRQKIESLNAYKKSVIYEAVTGKTIIE